MDQSLSYLIGMGQEMPEDVTTVGTGVASQQSRAFDREIHNDGDNHGP